MPFSKMQTSSYLFFCLCVSVHLTYARRRCLECFGVAQPLDCSTVTECGDHEHCFMEKYVTTNNVIYYDVGCKDVNLCSAVVPVGKREYARNNSTISSQRRSTSECLQCCNDKDICNLDGYCGAEKFTPPAGFKLCYSCPLAKEADSCNNMVLCDQDKYCSIAETTNLLNDKRWKHGCSEKSQCDTLTANVNNICSYCCETQLCNRNCTLPTLTVAPATTTTTTTPATTQVPKTKPKITLLDIQPHNFKYGDTVHITCVVTGNPVPTVHFMFRGAALGANTHVSGNHLTILNYSPIDDGDYRCVATNSLGDDMNQFSLHGHR